MSKTAQIRALAKDSTLGGKRALSPDRLRKLAADIIAAWEMNKADPPLADIARAFGWHWNTARRYLSDSAWLTEARRVLSALDELEGQDQSKAPPPPAEPAAPQPATPDGEAVETAIKMLLEAVPGLATLELTVPANGGSPTVNFSVHTVVSQTITL